MEDNISKLISHTSKVISNYSSRDRLVHFLEKNNIPYKNLRVIHVAGTSGKGSTSSMIAKGLEDSGYKVGLITSPHLVRINERIKVNSVPISDEDLNTILEKIYKDGYLEAFAETISAVAIICFLEKKVDYLVAEAFVGGERDTLNIFDSIATVITSIGLDHTHILGETKEEILKDKLGIVRKGIPLFTRLQNKIIEDKIKESGAIYKKVTNLEGTNLEGEYQRENAGIAYEVLRYLGVDDSNIKKSLMNINYPGRLQYLKSNLLVDCAHNELAMRRLSEYIIEEHSDKKILYLFAMSRNKDFKRDFQPYLINARKIVLTRLKIFKASKPDNFNEMNFEVYASPKEALNSLLKEVEENELIVVCGSIFLVGEIMESLLDE